MLSLLMERYGFCKEIAEIYQNMLTGKKYHINEIDEQLLQEMSVLRMAASILDRVIPIQPDATFQSWENEITWSGEGRNVLHELSPSGYFPEQLTVDAVKEIHSAARLIANDSVEFEDIVLGDEESQITAFLSSSILEAEDSIKAVAIDTALTNISTVWGALKKRISEGVQYYRICDLNELLLHGLSIKRKDIHFGVKLYVADKSNINDKFYLFDNSHVFIFEGDTEKKEKYHDSGQLINSEYIAKLYDDKFDCCLNGAELATEVISNLSDYFKQHSKSLDSKEREIYISLVEYGVFSEYQQEESIEINRLVEMGCIEKWPRGLTSYWLPTLSGY